MSTNSTSNPETIKITPVESATSDDESSDEKMSNTKNLMRKLLQTPKGTTQR